MIRISRLSALLAMLWGPMMAHAAATGVWKPYSDVVGGGANSAPLNCSYQKASDLMLSGSVIGIASKDCWGSSNPTFPFFQSNYKPHTWVTRSSAFYSGSGPIFCGPKKEANVEFEIKPMSLAEPWVCKYSEGARISLASPYDFRDYNGVKMDCYQKGKKSIKFSFGSVSGGKGIRIEYIDKHAYTTDWYYWYQTVSGSSVNTTRYHKHTYSNVTLSTIDSKYWRGVALYADATNVPICVKE